MDNYNETVINYFNNESVMELVIDPEPDNSDRYSDHYTSEHGDACGHGGRGGR